MMQFQVQVYIYNHELLFYIFLHSDMIQVLSICWSVSCGFFCLFSSAIILRRVNVAILQCVKQLVRYRNVSSQFGNSQFCNKINISIFFL